MYKIKTLFRLTVLKNGKKKVAHSCSSYNKDEIHCIPFFSHALLLKIF